MKKITDYFDLYLADKKEKREQSKALKELGLHPSSLKQYKEGSIPTDEPLIKLANKLNIEPMELLVLAGAERAKNKETKRIWLRFYNEIIKNKPLAEKIRETVN